MTDDQLRHEALAHEIWLHDQAQLILETGEDRFKEVLAEGHEQGLAEGERKTRMALVEEMKRQGFALDVISKLLKLPEEEIAGL